MGLLQPHVRYGGGAGGARLSDGAGTAPRRRVVRDAADADAALADAPAGASVDWVVALETLAAVYGDAYNSQLNDRYLGRWKEYVRLAEQTAEMVREVGVGIVRDPLPRPASPKVTPGGSPDAEATYSILTVWRSGNGAVSAASPAALYSTTGGTQPAVDPGTAPVNATGWDVYVGVDGGAALKQNSGVIPVGVLWTVPAGGPVSGLPSGPGQAPDYYVRRGRVLRKG